MKTSKIRLKKRLIIGDNVARNRADVIRYKTEESLTLRSIGTNDDHRFEREVKNHAPKDRIKDK